MTIQTVKIPFAKMSYTPDVPSAALGPNEYNSGKNVETDVRGIRSVAGDVEILDTIPGTPTFLTAGFRRNGEFWFVAATVEGVWWATNGDQTWTDITPPGVGDFSQYTQASNIMDSWNGNVLFINDAVNPPMFWPDEPNAVMVMYSNQVPLDITTITNTSYTTRTIGFTPQPVAPFQVGGYINVSQVNPRYYDGVFYVTSCTTATVTYTDNTIGPYANDGSGSVAPQYTWNYNTNWSNVYANFMRLYNTPNVGSILVAGNLEATDAVTTSTLYYPVTVQWSQAFGLNQAPSTWTPTISNVANQLEVPLRGPAVDAFPCNGQFFLCSYWDTVVFSPINYTTTSAPILGVRLYNQGRGLLTSNAWANTDTMVYGLDARDIWAFDGQTFTPLGNQRVKNWFFDQLDPQYYNRIWMEANTQKNQIEIYYPDKNAINGVPNKMLSYRFDIDCWNAPRDISNGTFSIESPYWQGTIPQYGLRTIVYARGQANKKLVMKDQGFSFLGTNTSTVTTIESVFRRDNIKILPNYTSKVMVHRVLPEVVNIGSYISQGNELQLTTSTGGIAVTIEGANSVGSTASSVVAIQLSVDANGNNGQNPWAQINQNAYRVNTLVLSTSSTSTIWLCNATTWQVTDVEEDR